MKTLYIAHLVSGYKRQIIPRADRNICKMPNIVLISAVTFFIKISVSLFFSIRIIPSYSTSYFFRNLFCCCSNSSFSITLLASLLSYFIPNPPKCRHKYHFQHRQMDRAYIRQIMCLTYMVP